MNYKEILYNLTLRYNRAVANNRGRRVGAKGIEEIVDTYSPTVEKERATDDHKRQYAAFLSDISSIVVDKETSKSLNWKEVAIGMVLGVGGGIYVGVTVPNVGGIAVLGGLAIGTTTATVASHVVRSMSYARRLNGVVDDYIQALNRVEVKQLEDYIDQKQLLEKSVMALESGDESFAARTAKAIRNYFSSRPEERKLLPPKTKKTK